MYGFAETDGVMSVNIVNCRNKTLLPL